jgi:hypothetical protein
MGGSPLGQGAVEQKDGLGAGHTASNQVVEAEGRSVQTAENAGLIGSRRERQSWMGSDDLEGAIK